MSEKGAEIENQDLERFYITNKKGSHLAVTVSDCIRYLGMPVELYTGLRCALVERNSNFNSSWRLDPRFVASFYEPEVPFSPLSFSLNFWRILGKWWSIAQRMPLGKRKYWESFSWPHTLILSDFGYNRTVKYQICSALSIHGLLLAWQVEIWFHVLHLPFTDMRYHVIAHPYTGIPQ